MEGGKISHATAAKLEQRRCEITTSFSKGVRNVGSFKGSIRAMEVTAGGNAVWTAETDGTIAIRQGVSGAVLFSIPRKRDVFVASLLAHGSFMWVGLSDGFLRIYNAETKELLHELRQHAGAITCFIEHAGRIYSGSTDRQIYSWDVHLPEKSPQALAKGSAPFLSQLSGHQNSIRCLAADDHSLYSAGDDCAIRCWDVNAAREHSAPWPIYGHKSAISALQVYEVFLFSASHDATIKIWNTQTGALVRTLDLHTGPVTCLLKDANNARIWSGGTDGLIGVWDAETHALVTKMHDHANTFVTSMRMLCRVHAMKAWSIGGNGVVKVWYFESDTPEVDFSEANKVEAELQAKIEAMRGTIIQNYQELERKKEQLRRLETAEDRRRRELAAAMGRVARTQVLRHHWGKLLEWNTAQRRAGKRAELAGMLARSTHTGLLSVYFHKLALFPTHKKEEKRKLELARNLGRITERGLASVYMRHLVDYVQIAQARKKKRMIAQALVAQTMRGFHSVYFNKWRRWLDLQKATSKRAFIADALVRNSDRAFMALHYHKLLAFAQQEHRREQNLLLANNVAAINAKPLLQYYYYKLLKFARRRKQRSFQYSAAVTLERSTARTLVHAYFRKWKTWRQGAQSEDLQHQLQERTQQLEQLRRLVALQGNVSDEEARRQLQGIQLQLAESRERLVDLHQENAKLRTASRLIGSELRINNIPLDKEAPVEEQLRHSIGYLKAKLVNVMQDFALIADVRERVKRGVAPTHIFLTAHSEIKRLVVELTQDNQVPGAEWSLRADALARIPLHSCRSTLAAIKEMAIVFDFIPSNEKDELETAEEVVRNIHWLDSLASAVLDQLARRGPARRRASPAKGAA